MILFAFTQINLLFTFVLLCVIIYIETLLIRQRLNLQSGNTYCVSLSEVLILVEIKNLTKIYGTHKAVDSISFTVKEGEILGFLGPNGAGKTTVMNIMTGYISSTDGDVKINGIDILQEPEKAKKCIGYMPDVPPIYGDMTVTEYLKFVCSVKKIKSDFRDDMIKKVIEAVKLEKVKNRLNKNLSKGYRQRVGLAQALVGFPKVLVLDEPTNGLDPTQIIEMREVIRNLGKKHTIILSSHILSEVSAVCDRVIILNNGKIIAENTLTDLTESIEEGSKIDIRIKGTPEDMKNLLKYEGFDYKILSEKEKGTTDAQIKGQEDIREKLFGLCVKKNITLLMLKPAAQTLEDIFMQTVSGKASATAIKSEKTSIPEKPVSVVSDIISDDSTDIDKFFESEE